MTRTELDAMTAKALRPIAADLGITGASRMRKDDLISAIVAAQDTDAAKSEGDIADFDAEAVYAQAEQVTADHDLALTINDKLTQVARLEAHPSREARSAAYDVRDEILSAGFREQAVADVPRQQAPRIKKHSSWAMSYPLAKGGDGNVCQGHADYCATWGHATETSTDLDGVKTVSGHCPRCGDTLPASQVAEKIEELIVAADIPAELCAHGIDATRRCSICREDAKRDRHAAKDIGLMVHFGENGAEVIEESDGRCPYGNIHEIETCFPCGTEDESGNQIEAVLVPKQQTHAEMHHKADGTCVFDECPEAPKFKAGDRFEITIGYRTSLVELIDLDPSGGPGFAWRVQLVSHIGDERFTSITLTEDFLTQDYVSKVEAPQYFARQTRKGLETVVLEREHGGRVGYRIIDSKTGRRSAPYRMRSETFRAQYVAVPAR